MNDDFLYELRNNPPAEFATRLKARLERQTVEAQRRQRAFRWAAIAAMLVGSTAIAFVSPTVRQATLTMIVQLRGGESQAPIDPQLQRLIEQKDARAEQRIMPEASFDERQLPGEREWSAASARGASGAATFATQPDGGSAVAPSAASGGVTNVAGVRGRIQLRMGHNGNLATAAQQIAATLENDDAALDIGLTTVSATPGECVRGGEAANQDLWIDDRSAPGANDACVNGSRFIKVPFALDAIVLVIHRENTWARTVNVEDLRRLRDRSVTDPLQVWSQLRPEWPTLPIALVGTSLLDSEVGRRFATAVGLNVQPTPSMFVPMKDDRATLKYVESTLGAIGFIDYATWVAVLNERSATTTVVAVTNEQGEAIQPAVATIQERRYPLSRPLWLYVSEKRFFPLFRSGAVRPTLERMMRSSTLEASGLIPLEHAGQREATRLLRGY